MNQEIESALEFPCVFAIKAFGHSHPGFQQIVVEIVREHAPEIDEDAVTIRPSRGGKYLAVTVTIVAESRAQLDAIYRALTDSEHVLMAL